MAELLQYIDDQTAPELSKNPLPPGLPRPPAYPLPTMFKAVLSGQWHNLSDHEPGHGPIIRRLVKLVRFDGEVVAGQKYLLIDDAVTQGGTIADLRGYIESSGSIAVV